MVVVLASAGQANEQIGAALGITHEEAAWLASFKTNPVGVASLSSRPGKRKRWCAARSNSSQLDKRFGAQEPWHKRRVLARPPYEESDVTTA